MVPRRSLGPRVAGGWGTVDAFPSHSRFLVARRVVVSVRRSLLCSFWGRARGAQGRPRGRRRRAWGVGGDAGLEVLRPSPGALLGSPRVPVAPSCGRIPGRGSRDPNPVRTAEAGRLRPGPPRGTSLWTRLRWRGPLCRASLAGAPALTKLARAS